MTPQDITTGTRAVSTWFDLPLLRRELLETAQQRRLWVIRSLLAAAQMLFVVVNYDDLADSQGGLGAFGGGQEIADVLNVCNMIAIYLLLPLTACAAIAAERERQTLPLLLVSRISASRLVLEKFLSSMIPVVTVMALNLPSLTLAYSLGGLSPHQLAGSVTAMLVAAVQVNTAAIFWSAVFRTSLQAFWGTLFTLLAYLIGPGMLGLLIGGRFFGRVLGFSVEVHSLFVGFWELPSLASLEDAVRLSLPPLLAGASFLVGAVVVVTKYRCEAPLSRLPRPLHILRGIVKRLRKSSPAANTAVPAAAGSELIPPMRVPADEPVAWRECATTASYGTRHFFALALLFVPSGFWMLTKSDLNFDEHGACIALNLILMVSAVLVVQGLGARSFGLERDRETLAVLLTTPLTTHEILIQKLAAARRARLRFMPAFLAVSAISLWHADRYTSHMDLGVSRWVVEPLSLVLIWEQLTFAIQVATIWSICSRTTLRAAVGTLATLFGYCLLHFFLVFLVLEILDGTYDFLLPGLPLIAWISTLVDEMPVRGSGGQASAILWLWSSPVLFGLVLAGLQTIIMRQAGKWLGRE